MRVAIAAAGLLFLAVMDCVAIARSSYCPVGWRRQTPRSLLRRYDMRVVALVWGFDTGLLVTTFRMAAVSWGALVLTALGLSHGWTGMAMASDSRFRSCSSSSGRSSGAPREAPGNRDWRRC